MYICVYFLTAVFQREEGVVRREGFGRRHVQPGRGDLPRGQGLVEVLLVHHSSPEQRGFRSVNARTQAVTFI